MTNLATFDFGTDSVATAYDDVLVPLMFEPWANALIEEHRDWHGKTVLDLATGTGIVARLAAEQVGPTGRVIGTDLNGEMLARARQKSADAGLAIDFIESPAHPLDIPSESIDIALCQQGFQFFPDRLAAARELHRVLRPEGCVFVSTWCPVGECVFFEWICDALDEIGEPEIETMMRLPFDHMPPSELLSLFNEAGFSDVKLDRRTEPLKMQAGASQAVATAYATPIGPKLAVLPEQQREAFNNALSRLVDKRSPDGVTMGELVAYVLKAVKAGR